MAAAKLKKNGESVRSLGRLFKVDESSLRYRLKRLEDGATDGRQGQAEICSGFSGEIAHWMEAQEESARRLPIKDLYESLVTKGYEGSYKSVVRYVRRRQAPPKIRPIRRVEVKPGSQAQVDWFERKVFLESHQSWTKVYGFIYSLGFSRAWVILWSFSMQLLHWIACHNEALLRMGGVAEHQRIDNLKTGVSKGCGAWAVIHAGYEMWARQVGTIINACRVRTPQDKGKVERRVRDVSNYLDFSRSYQDLDHLQRVTDQAISQRMYRLVHPILGSSFAEALEIEQRHLLPLPLSLPEPFDIQVRRKVRRDATVPFEGREYGIPMEWIEREVLVRGLAGQVEILSGEGKTIGMFPRHTVCRSLVDQSIYEGEGTDRVAPATPLGRIGQEIVIPNTWEYEAQTRGISAYADLVEGI